MMPLESYIKQERVLAFLRTEASIPLRGAHRRKIKAQLESLGFQNCVHDQIEESRQFNRRFKVLESSFKKGNPNCEADLKIYTDGSRIKDRAGSGVFISESDGTVTQEMSYHLGKYPTVFQAEIYAIKQAANWLLEYGINDKQISIFVDSQSALKALAAPIIKSFEVLEALKHLNEAGANNYFPEMGQGSCWPLRKRKSRSLSQKGV